MEVEIGWVTEYFDQIGMAVLMLRRMLKVGDQIRIQGQVMDVTQEVTCLEIDHTSVLWAQPGDDVALAVTGPVNVHDRVYRIAKNSS